MVEIKFRQSALNDLNEIWDYTYEKWSESQADRYYFLIKSGCEDLIENPELGRAVFGN